MEALDALLIGFSSALTPTTLMWGFIGCFVGTMVGVLPGLGPALTIALLLPLTYHVPATSMFVMFAGIYYGAAYGGATTSILLNTPGETSSVITALEGNKMARSGRAGQALATAAIGSFVAGTLGTLALTFIAPELVEIALAFGPAEYFSLMVLALVAVSAVLGNSLLRGLIALSLGLLIGMVGIDLQTGQMRFTFGQPQLLDGIEITVAAVGIFAVGEALFLAWQGRSSTPSSLMKLSGSLWMSARDWSRSWKAWIRGALFGFPIGAMPAGGAELPTLLSYYTEKKLSKHPEEFGKGAIEGVAGPEAANNASAAGVLMPLLTLGIPTSATAAVMLSAFESYGIQTGPQLFSTNSALVWTLIASLYIGNVILLLLNLPLIGLWVRLLKIPPPWLYASIIIVSIIGVYSAGNSVFNVGLLFVFGLIGYVMRRFDFPAPPVLMGLILAPLAEQSMRQALTISQGQWTTFVTRPLSASLLGIALLLLIAQPVYRHWRNRQPKATL